MVTNTTLSKSKGETRTPTPASIIPHPVNDHHTAIVSSNLKNNDDALFDRKIEIASEGLTSHYSACFYKIPLKENAQTLAAYISSMKSEINPSDNYREEVIEKLSRLSICHGKTLFKDMTREQILNFLENARKPEALDPLHKWIGTYNLSRVHLIHLGQKCIQIRNFPGVWINNAIKK